MSQRSKHMQQDESDDFREDVITYGAILYDVLKKRQDFGSVRVRDNSNQRRLKKAAHAI